MTLTLPGPSGIGTGGGRACALWLPGDHWRGTIAVRRPTISPYYSVHALHAPRRFSRHTDIVVDRSQANVTHCSWHIRSGTRFRARARIENGRHTASTSRGGQFNHLPHSCVFCATTIGPCAAWCPYRDHGHATRREASFRYSPGVLQEAVWMKGQGIVLAARLFNHDLDNPHGRFTLFGVLDMAWTQDTCYTNGV